MRNQIEYHTHSIPAICSLYGSIETYREEIQSISKIPLFFQVLYFLLLLVFLIM